jgi:hypothetical protein
MSTIKAEPTPDDAAWIEAFNAASRLRNMRASFDPISRARPLQLSIFTHSNARKHLAFTSTVEMEQYVTRYWVKQDHIESELEKLRVTIKMHDLGERITVARGTYHKSAPFKVSYHKDSDVQKGSKPSFGNYQTIEGAANAVHKLIWRFTHA